MTNKSLKQNLPLGEALSPLSLNAKKQAWVVGSLCLVLFLLDQIVKFWIKLSLPLGESIHVTNWFQILFVENEGMAFGVTLGSKLFLTLFRICAMALFGWGVVAILKKGTYKLGFVVAMGLILVGGIGNIIDSLFYGLIFSESAPLGAVAELFPEGGGYASLFHGKVVDMLYFPLIDTYLPTWLPFVGGQHFTFFDPVFNLADSYISIGVFMLILFYFKSLSRAFEQLSLFLERKREKSIKKEE